eukprot:4131911-Prymnesium_polylepis.1
MSAAPKRATRSGSTTVGRDGGASRVTSETLTTGGRLGGEEGDGGAEGGAEGGKQGGGGGGGGEGIVS